MAINYKDLPVYQQKEIILKALNKNQVIVVQSPTGSGKTTQLPVILHEAGYSKNGIIAVTQPRRIAALSVSEFISKQLGTKYPGLVGYKMRFEDKTDYTTKIKIMTDGILLQEMKLDPYLSKYSVIMVDEAHERSLNIDFVLGLLKRVLDVRSDFKIIVSSATMNAESFSKYFNECPIVNIDTITFPVSVIYDPPAIPASTSNTNSQEALLEKIESTLARILENKISGDVLIFLPGEKIIKDCILKLYRSHYSHKLHIIPLYGRLAKEEQERVFENPPLGKKKIVISTNIAETSITISGITAVIDSGLAKLNYYNPRTFTSSLIESPVSKASCNQRKGRAGRTQEGSCYRLYPRKDFESRQMYTLEEIFRTDLSEVVLRMSELGITDFESFDFISQPGKEEIISAEETLKLLKALEDDNTLSEIGKIMVQFPLEPRLSRIIVEAIMNYPTVLEETLIAAAFLSAQNPFILPSGQEMQARIQHQKWSDENGDFVSYIKIFSAFLKQKNTEKFCGQNFLDHRIMLEIKNIVEQLEIIVNNMGLPITSGGKIKDYLTCIASGMIQFICIRSGKNNFRSLTADCISIHPGSCMCKKNPQYIVAGEIVRTSRMFAMSVSPLKIENLNAIDRSIYEKLKILTAKNIRTAKNEVLDYKIKNSVTPEEKINDENKILLGKNVFEIRKIKGKKHIIIPSKKYLNSISNIKIEKWKEDSQIVQLSKLKCIFKIDKYEIFKGEKFETLLNATPHLNFSIIFENDWNKNKNFYFQKDTEQIINLLPMVLRLSAENKKKKVLGFVSLYTDGKETFWFKTSKGFSTAVYETLNSLEKFIQLTNEKNIDFSEEKKEQISKLYGKLQSIL
ncbi:MAG: helicase-related protein [Treponemataceae bacterium]